jgi:iron complex outermembrane receptor protein
VKDRVVLSGQFSADDSSLNPALTSALRGLRVSLAQFFANAVNTTNQGIDLVFDYNKRFGNNSLRALLAANFQKMTIDQINVPDRLNDSEGHRATFLSDREQRFILASAPPVKISSNLEYGLGKLSIGARLNYFGEITLLGYGEDGSGIAPMVPTDADENKYVEDKFVYGAKLVPDLYFAYRLSDKVALNLGVDNIANVHPDLGFAPGAAGWAFNNETGGPWDAVQMGGNGRRFFARLALNF